MDAWWWNEEVKGAVTRKKNVHKAMCQNNTEETKSMKNIARRAVSKATREKADEALADLRKLTKLDV